MKRKVFLSLLAMGLTCMVLLTLIFGWMFRNYSRRQAEEELNLTLATVATGISQSRDPLVFLNTADLQENGIRVTWITASGRVLYDSMADSSQMESHEARPEFRAALETGEGKAERESGTLDESMLYKARRLPGGTVLRAAVRERTIYGHLRAVFPYIVLILLAAGFVCYHASRKLSRDLLHPLHQVVRLVEHIGRNGATEQQKLEEAELMETDEELRPLVQKIADLTRALSGTLHDLEHQRNMIRMIIENMQEGVILTDETRHIMAANRSAVRLLKADLEDRVRGVRLPPCLPELDWDLDRNKTEVQRLQRGNRVYQVTTQPIYTEGRYYGLLVVFDDMTEIEEREQLRREFTSNVSHELKTPLTSFTGFSEVLKEHLFQNEDDAAHFGSLIYKEAKRLLALIDDILHLGRIEARAVTEKEWEAVNLAELIKDVVTFLEPVLQDKKVAVRCTLEDVVLDADSGLMREMLINLVDNAVKYNLPGGHVYIGLVRREADAVLSVRDTGIGIPEEDQERVFERFYRVDTSRTRSGKISGTGLGLAIVKHIVDLHKGAIRLHSVEGRGTEFTVTLPLKQCSKGV